MAEKLTTLAKRLRPFINGQVGAIAATGAYMQEGPGIDLVGNKIGLGGDTILLYKANGTPVQEFPATMAGINSAHAAAVSGDRIIFPTIMITCTAGVTIPAGVAWYYAKLSFSGFAGTAVTMNNNSSMDQCEVTYDGSGQANAIGVSALDVEFAYLNLSTVSVHDATNNTGIYARGIAYARGIVLKSSGAKCWNGTSCVGLLLEEYTYAIHSFGEAADASNSNIGINLSGDVSGYTNAPQVISSWAWAQDGGSETYGVYVTAAKYGTLVSTFCYAIPGGVLGTSTGLNLQAGSTLYCGNSTWNDLTGTGTIVHLRGCEIIDNITPIIVNPHPGAIDECTVRAYVNGKVYWSSHRTTAGGSDLGYEYAYNTVAGTNAELSTQAGQAGWESVYNAADGLIYVGGQIYADAIAFRSAVWTINPVSGAVSYTALNAAGEATGDINEIIGILDDGTQLVGGERGPVAGTTGSDFPNGGGVWTIPKASIGAPASFTRVYEDAATPKREWRFLAKYGSTYIGLLIETGAGKYVLRSSTDLVTWNDDVSGMALALNDIRAAMIYHVANGVVYAATVNSSRQIEIRAYNGSWSTLATFTNLTVPATGTVMLTLGTSGNNLILMVSEWTTYTHAIYLIFNLDGTPDYITYATGVDGANNTQIIEAGPDIYYCTCYPGGLNRIRLWDSTGLVAFDDTEGDPVDVDRTARADGTSIYAARRDHRHELGTVNVEHLSNVDTAGKVDGAAFIWDNSLSKWRDSILIRDDGSNVMLGNASNYLNIDSDGTITLVGDARVKREVRVDIGRARVGASAPTLTNRAVGSSGNVLVPVDQFSKTIQQDVYFEIHAPTDMDNTEDVIFHLMWFPGASWTAGNYMWKLEYIITEETGVELDANAPATIQADVTPAAATNVIETEFATAISGFSNENVLWCHFYRDVANDNADDVGSVRWFEIEYTMNKLGEKYSGPINRLIDESSDYLIDENGDYLTD